MKVKDLKNALALIVGEGREGHLLVSISHWVNRLRTAQEGYRAVLPQDIQTVKRLKELNIVEITGQDTEGVTAVLTREGKELYRDFIAHGYF